MNKPVQLHTVPKTGMTKWLLDSLWEEGTNELIFLDPKVEITEESLALLPADIKEIFRLSLQTTG